MEQRERLSRSLLWRLQRDFYAAVNNRYHTAPPVGQHIASSPPEYDYPEGIAGHHIYYG